jgi:hypothetical protein
MRLLALVILIIGSLGAQRALAQETSIQPLTRADCAAAGMNWDENANVCGVEEAPGQPLTRADCGKAGTAWNETANVCGPDSELAEGASRPNPLCSSPSTKTRKE